jgi:hypothetical protein
MTREELREKLLRLRATYTSRSIVCVCDDHGAPVGMVWRKARQWHAVSSLPCPYCGDHCDRMCGSNPDRNIVLATMLAHINRGAARLQ